MDTHRVSIVYWPWDKRGTLKSPWSYMKLLTILGSLQPLKHVNTSNTDLSSGIPISLHNQRRKLSPHAWCGKERAAANKRPKPRMHHSSDQWWPSSDHPLLPLHSAEAADLSGSKAVSSHFPSSPFPSCLSQNICPGLISIRVPLLLLQVCCAGLGHAIVVYWHAAFIAQLPAIWEPNLVCMEFQDNCPSA